MKKLFTTLMMAGLMIPAVCAEDKADFYPATTSVVTSPGEQFELVFNLDNTIMPTSFQFYLEASEGITVAKNAKKKYIVQYADRFDPEDYTLQALDVQGKNEVYFAGYTYLGEEDAELLIQPGDGAFVTVTMQVDENAKSGDYVVNMIDAMFVTVDETEYTSPDVEIPVKVVADLSTGVDTLTNDNAEAVYYNLQGVKVGEGEPTPGIYLRRVGSKTEKVIIK